MKRFIANAILNTLAALFGLVAIITFLAIFYLLGSWPLVIGVALLVALIIWCVENAD